MSEPKADLPRLARAVNEAYAKAASMPAGRARSALYDAAEAAHEVALDQIFLLAARLPSGPQQKALYELAMAAQRELEGEGR